jgi:hypothetical protein
VKSWLKILLLGAIFIAGVIPQVLLAVFLTDLPIYMFVVLWGVFLVIAWRSSRLVVWFCVVLFPFILSIPPYPNFIGSDNAGLHVQFIGTAPFMNTIRHAPVPYIFFAVLFILTAWVIRGRRGIDTAR